MPPTRICILPIKCASIAFCVRVKPTFWMFLAEGNAGRRKGSRKQTFENTQKLDCLVSFYLYMFNKSWKVLRGHGDEHGIKTLGERDRERDNPTASAEDGLGWHFWKSQPLSGKLNQSQINLLGPCHVSKAAWEKFARPHSASLFPQWSCTSLPPPWVQPIFCKTLY